MSFAIALALEVVIGAHRVSLQFFYDNNVTMRLPFNDQEARTTPITARTKIIIRGATNHFNDNPSYARNILEYTRLRKINYVVITTGMASQGLQTYFRRLRKTGNDANVEPLQLFKGDEDNLLAALTGKSNPTIEDVKLSLHEIVLVLKRMRKQKGRILVLCQVGRNRSFTTAFLYYLVYHGVGKSVVDNLRTFKSWPGVSYDYDVQADGSQRLDETHPELPWMQGLVALFEDPTTRVVTKATIQRFMAN